MEKTLSPVVVRT